MKSYEEKLLAMVIKPKKIEALDRHLKLRALGFLSYLIGLIISVFISAVHKHISHFHIILH